jgi:tetratricopeptide (TPR) repeat protein
MAQPSPGPPGVVRRDWLEQFGRRLSLARAQAGMTQQALAAPDLTKSFISLLEGGRSQPSVETVISLAGRLNASVGALLLDPTSLRRETASNLLHLASQMDLAARGSEALQLLASAEVLLPDVPADLRAKAALLRARVAIAGNRLDEATEWADRAVDETRRYRYASLLGMALALKGLVELRRGAYKAALPLLEEATTTLQRSKAARTEENVRALLSLGTVHFQSGRSTRARRAYRRALELSTRLRLHMLGGRALTGLGLVAWQRRRLDEAEKFFGQAHDALVMVEDLPEISRVLSNLGLVLRDQGRLDDALRVLRQALRVQERLQAPRDRSATLDEMAHVYLALGRPADAVQASRRAIKEAQDGADPEREAVACMTLGNALRAQGRRRDAIKALRDAITIFTDLGLEERVSKAAGELGLLLREEGAHAEAASYLEMALRTGKKEPTAPSAVPLIEALPG